MSAAHDSPTQVSLPTYLARAQNPDATWQTTRVTNGLFSFFDPCQFYFAASEITIVESGYQDTVLHRPTTVSPEEVINR
ncbi:hypothetical protein [Haladaptatus caseinilyticus]|uniref:hypothetical protein n=1 Tax=Haladaptatus caseinilyticus TaxID=2993314 RepID=UPI00224A7EBD|nr:hypothetical protein [Haladaptatus caseinilyticus]